MKLRKIHILAVVVILSGLDLGWMKFNGDDNLTTPVTARVERGSVAETVLASGMLEASQLVSVGARASGQIETLAVALGDQVKAGDLIAQIDSQDQQNTVLQADADLANITAQIAAKAATLSQARITLTRYQELGKQNISTQETVDTAAANVAVYTADLDALEAQKSSAEVTVSSAKVALERTRITAPIDGTVVAVVVQEGQTVNATQSAPTIVKIADLSTMLVKAEISEADVMNVAKDQNVTFTTLGAADTPFHAVVRDIEPAPTEIEESDTISSDSAIYYNGLLEVANPDGKLRIGMTAEVSIELARADDVLTVPSAAIKRDPGGTYVDVLDPATGGIDHRSVTVGLDNRLTAEISDGVAQGDLVITGTTVATKPKASDGGRMGPPMF
ncbi:efflux RND transporter periplasmic adaptor subunit [Paracoccus sp. JM45]|uniref:efflux RND transporter periplasmic adaptor subunit n=1 Tax=Paracoccus sp. JM45 TaxID=2283626 RepID=UPI000E6D0109|nr:efflux RND transporter periplasmic adaptor subunit [Paracoccus sp. JM45]RJE79188.1 efflux RND transporter periplasmic adaptor subunit [Paracoccus sp. JM45]